MEESTESFHMASFLELEPRQMSGNYLFTFQ